MALPIPTELTSLRTRRAAAALAVAWGYPRAVTELEIRAGRWWTTANGVAWLIWGISKGEVHMHGVGRPGARRVISSELTRLVLEAARGMGARRVYQPLLDQYPALERLWRRAGWTKRDAVGPYMEVG